jgi:hypothetical protein
LTLVKLGADRPANSLRRRYTEGHSWVRDCRSTRKAVLVKAASEEVL